MKNRKLNLKIVNNILEQNNSKISEKIMQQ